jgi:hypothetical protein
MWDNTVQRIRTLDCRWGTIRGLQKRDVVCFGALVNEPKSGGRDCGVSLSQLMSTAVHVEPK